MTNAQPTFIPEESYDHRGVFTGCFHPAGPHGERDQLSVIYTAVSYLPIDYDKPHKRGSEAVAIATSSDGGKSCR